MKPITILIISLICAVAPASACTSMIVSGNASASGRPLLCKHRDTGADNNFIARVEPADGRHGYVGLFNAGDSTLSEAWMGMNDAGFAIMNTASYNLAPDTAAVKDREGVVMALALATCTTVDDFAALLESLEKPRGVQANFGVIDACGCAAYFETDDWHVTRFDVADSPTGTLIRTNYSMTGADGKGYGYIRYNNADYLTREAVKNHSVTPELFTETVSRSYYHSLIGRDMSGDDIVVDQDFIPRNISTSSIVIEGVNPSDNVTDAVMWTALGYPPCAVTQPVTLTEIPEGLRADNSWRSPDCDTAMQQRRAAFPFTGGSGTKYLDLRVLRPVIDACREQSLKNYENFRKSL